MSEKEREIERWFDSRGLGFIDPDDGEQKVFFHISEFKPLFKPEEGLDVEFKVESRWNGLKAVNVVPQN